MLDELERKLTALVADALGDRAHVSDVVTAGPPPTPAAGKTVIRVALATLSRDAGFDASRTAFGGTPAAPTSRRVLPVHVAARVGFRFRLTGPTDVARADGRALVMGDLSRVGHALDLPAVQTGAAFRTAAPDPGFEVHGFLLEEGDLDPKPEAGGEPDVLVAELRYAGAASVWPPVVAGPEGVTRAVEVNLVPVPVALTAANPVVRTGSSTPVRISGVPGRRRTGVDPATFAPLQLALRVTSDLPPAQRGRLDGGTAGTPSGTRIVTLTGPATDITYVAPAGDLGTVRVEFVAVHLATPEGDAGVFLDSLALRLEPAQ